jgi:hypothetical protein
MSTVMEFAEGQLLENLRFLRQMKSMDCKVEEVTAKARELLNKSAG